MSSREDRKDIDLYIMMLNQTDLPFRKEVDALGNMMIRVRNGSVEADVVAGFTPEGMFENIGSYGIFEE